MQFDALRILRNSMPTLKKGPSSHCLSKRPMMSAPPFPFTYVSSNSQRERSLFQGSAFLTRSLRGIQSLAASRSPSCRRRLIMSPGHNAMSSAPPHRFRQRDHQETGAPRRSTHEHVRSALKTSCDYLRDTAEPQSDSNNTALIYPRRAAAEVP